MCPHCIFLIIKTVLLASVVVSVYYIWAGTKVVDFYFRMKGGR